MFFSNSRRKAFNNACALRAYWQHAMNSARAVGNAPAYAQASRRVHEWDRAIDRLV